MSPLRRAIRPRRRHAHFPASVTEVAVLGAVALCLSPGAAVAGSPGDTVKLGKSKGIQYLKATYRDVVTQSAQPVQCPQSTPLGGGGSISGDGANAMLNESYPDLPMGTWNVEGTGPNGSPRKLVGYATCGSETASHQTAQEALGGDSPWISNQVSCPGFGERVTGGGVSATGSGVLMGWTFPAAPGSWLSLARNPTQNDTIANYHVVCSADYTTRYRDGSASSVGRDKDGAAKVKCKRDEAVTGGGWLTSADDSNAAGPWTLATKPIDLKADGNKTPDDGWAVRVHNASLFKVDLTAYAACTKGPAIE